MRYQCPGPQERPEERHTAEQRKLAFGGQPQTQLGTGHTGVGAVLCSLLELVANSHSNPMRQALLLAPESEVTCLRPHV